jgi:biopolymer transport protein ExbD
MFTIAVALTFFAALFSRGLAEPDKPEAMIAVDVAQDGTITFQDKKVTLDELVAKVKHVENKAHTVVAYTASRKTPFKDLHRIVSRLEELGFKKWTMRAND